jgi:hypothetical protein
MTPDTVGTANKVPHAEPFAATKNCEMKRASVAKQEFDRRSEGRCAQNCDRCDTLRASIGEIPVPGTDTVYQLAPSHLRLIVFENVVGRPLLAVTNSRDA